MPHTVSIAKIVRLAAAPPSDPILIERFLQGDSAALESIVRRHGPSVLGVCQRALGRSADVDDAFQATFLTLTLRASSIRNPGVLSAWLHGVALRCCRKAFRRRTNTPLQDVADRSDPFADVTWRELRGLIDEELNRLPAKCRAPLILCHLESQTRDEAAKTLGWSLRTLDRRLSQGREMLKARLVRRGVGGLGLGVSILGSDGLTACLPQRLVEAVCRSGKTISPTVRSLVAPTTTNIMFKMAFSLVLVLGGLGVVFGIGSDKPVVKEVEPTPKTEVADHLELPLPDGVLRRFGTTRYRFQSSKAHAVMSRDGKLIAIGGYHLVVVYDVATGKPIYTFEGCGMTNSVGRLPGMAFSPDGKRLAHLAQGDAAARIWSMETGKEVCAVKGFSSRFTTGLARGNEEEENEFPQGIYFLDAGTKLALIGQQKLYIRDTTTGAAIAKYDLPTIDVLKAVPIDNLEKPPPGQKEQLVRDWAHPLSYSPDGTLYVSYVASHWQVGTVGDPAKHKVLLTKTSTPPNTKERRPEPFAAISQDNKYLALPTDNMDGVEIWEFGTKKLVRTLTLKEGSKLVDHLSFSTDGQYVYAGGERTVYRWEVASGKTLPALVNHASWGAPRTFADADAKNLCTVGWEGVVRRWDSRTGKQLEGPHGYTWFTMTDLSDAHAVVADGSGRIDLWSLNSDERHELYAPQAPQTRQVRFSPSGKLLAAGFSDGSIRVWEVATRKELKQFHANTAKQPTAINGLCWSPDEACVYVTTDLNGVVAWDWRTSTMRWQTNITHATKLCASADGIWVAALRTEQWEIPILNTVTGKVHATVTKPSPDKDRYSAPDSIVFHPNSRTLLAGHYDGFLRVWDVETGKERANYPSDRDVMWAIDVSRDGRYVVSGSSNGAVRVWDLDTGKEAFHRGSPYASSYYVRFSSDGRSVLSAQSKTPLLWSMVETVKGEREAHWNNLTADSKAAYLAQWSLADSDGIAEFLRKKLGEKVPHSAAKRIEQLIADLKNDSFRKREAASTELFRLGRVAETAIRAALEQSASSEQKQRLEALVARFDQGLSGEELQLRRALRVLTVTRDPEAKKVLAEWATGMEGAPLTELAKAALAARSE